jgi:hypothetical protein
VEETMSKMRWIGLSAMVAALGSTLGCASADVASAPSKTPAAPAVDVGSSAGPAPEAPAEPAAPSTGAETEGDAVARPAQPSKEEQRAPGATARPGLGTEWGETRTSRITTAPFFRADPSSPFAMASVFYNDEQGARAMAGAAGFARTGPQAFPLAGGAITVGLRGEDGRFLSGFVAEGNRFVVGQAGMRYTIVLQNLTDSRFECVVSVDGLDVLDGQAASFAKRGYILDPHGELEIDGFRQSVDEVAAFRFGSVRNSYANRKHGDARNVGVIGVALFHERGTAPWTPEEVQRRQNANPFPGQFATPPGTP